MTLIIAVFLNAFLSCGWGPLGVAVAILLLAVLIAPLVLFYFFSFCFLFAMRFFSQMNCSNMYYISVVFMHYFGRK